MAMLGVWGLLNRYIFTRKSVINVDYVLGAWAMRCCLDVNMYV